MLYAAIAWKSYGTKITGLDIVDLTQPLHDLAVQHGVVDNTSFVEGNLYVMNHSLLGSTLMTFVIISV